MILGPVITGQARGFSMAADLRASASRGRVWIGRSCAAGSGTARRACHLGLVLTSDMPLLGLRAGLLRRACRASRSAPFSSDQAHERARGRRWGPIIGEGIGPRGAPPPGPWGAPPLSPGFFFFFPPPPLCRNERTAISRSTHMHHQDALWYSPASGNLFPQPRQVPFGRNAGYRVRQLLSRRSCRRHWLTPQPEKTRSHVHPLLPRQKSLPRPGGFGRYELRPCPL